MSGAPDFSVHRQRLLDQLKPNEAVLLFGGPHHIRNGDAEFRYRPQSDLYWLTGWEDPGVALFIRPGDTPFTLFVQPKDKEREIWTGFRPGPEGAKDDYGMDVAHNIGELPKLLPGLLRGVSVLHYAFSEDADNDQILMGAIQKARNHKGNRYHTVPETFVSPSRLLHELRLIKSPGEIKTLKEAARITAHAHLAAMAQTRPGINEYEIESTLLHTFRNEGGEGPGYTPIVAGGENACILHYIRNNEILLEGDLLLIDAGAEFRFYTADVTRTFPINGRFTEPQRAVYAWVLRALVEATDQARSATPYSEMHKTAVRVLTEGMVDLGLLEGEVDELIESKAYRKYYMHGTGHWLGLDVHDVGVYGRNAESRPLEPGMVVTVEPGIYVAPDDEDAPAELRGIGIRIEDDVLVTDNDPIVLTEAIPKTIEALEAACLNRG